MVFKEDKILGQIEFPSLLTGRRHRRMVGKWLDKITRPIDPDPRPFLLSTMIDGRLSYFGREHHGKVAGCFMP
jgi:hypothetical protein